MPHEQLDNLVRVGQLKAEPSSEQEVAGLAHSARKDQHLRIETVLHVDATDGEEVTGLVPDLGG